MDRNNHSSRRPLAALIAALALLGAPTADALAETTAYYLNQSNIDATLPDGTNYLKVTITSHIAGTAIFDITPVFAHAAGANYGLQSFGFNYQGATAPAALTFAGLPTGWAIDPPPPSALDGFGKFDFIVGDGGQHRVAALSFTIGGLGGSTTAETLGYFAKTSDNGKNKPGYYFAAHLADFKVNQVDVASVDFAGSTLAAVPEPESWAMLLAGLSLVGALARRRTS